MSNMNDVIDMTMSNPFLDDEDDTPTKMAMPMPGSATAAVAVPKPPLMIPPQPVAGMAAGMPMVNPAFQAIQAIAASRQLHLSSHSLQLSASHHQLRPAHMHAGPHPPQAMCHLQGHQHCHSYHDDDDDHSMDSMDDDHSHSSWSDSEDEDDEEYVMFAPTAGRSHGHLLRPMSVQQITALAMATGARKPSDPNLAAQSSHHNMQHSATAGSMSAPQSSENLKQRGMATLGPRSVSMPSIHAGDVAHYQQQQGAQCPCTHVDVSKPEDVLKDILLKEGGSNGKTMDYCSFADIPHFFLQVQPQHIEAFQQEIISAVRTKNLPALQQLHRQGKLLQCCNKFGESIVHMACRQSNAEVVQYLLSHGISIRVCCDSGRTPLHDACWTQSPDFDVISILLAECPDLLRVKDKRGFSPLAYVPHGQWRRWGHFLEQNKHLLVFKGFN